MFGSRGRGRGGGDRGGSRGGGRGRGRGGGDRGMSRGRGRGSGDRGGFRGSSRGRGGGDREGFRGGSRGRGGGDREGFRGGGRGRGGGDREGFRGGGRGRGGGDRGGGFRGSSRGRGDHEERGGFRGSRGSFRGSDRGNGFDRGGRGSWADSESRGRGGSFGRGRGRGGLAPADHGKVDEMQIIQGKKKPHQRQKESEIKLGLQLYVAFKKTPVVIDELENLPGFHSVNSPPNKKELEKVILFKDMESLEAAKATLDAHENVLSTNQRGLNSVMKKHKASNACKVYLSFCQAVDQAAVKKLDNSIKEVALFTEKNSCVLQFATAKEAKIAAGKLKRHINQIQSLLQVDMYKPSAENEKLEDLTSFSQVFLKFNEAYDEKAIKKLDNTIEAVLPVYSCSAEFATHEEAEIAAKKLKAKIGENALRLVDLYSVPSKAVNNVQHDKIVLRDVPKEASLKDFVTQFPHAISIAIYKKTFPSSNFCHAHVGFETKEQAAETLEMTDLKIAGRKVRIFPAYPELLQEMPDLGEPEIKEEANVEDVEATEEPPSKKIKTELKNEDEDTEDEDADEEDADEEDADEEDVEEGEEEGEEEEDESDEEDQEEDESD